VFGVVGDTGQTEVTHAVFEHLIGMKEDAAGAGGIDVLLHTGDLSYADGFPPRWDSFGRLAEPLMSTVPMLSVVGRVRRQCPSLPSLTSHVSLFTNGYSLTLHTSYCSLTFIEPQAAHMVSINQPNPPFCTPLIMYFGCCCGL